MSLSWLVVKRRGLAVVRFPHFCNKPAEKTAQKLHENGVGALTTA
jgi:hypothetical protein